MTWTLLTNDDGVDSPALPAFAHALATGRDVRVVVPDRERSWVAKAITRYDPVDIRSHTVDGVDAVACTGYPADAVQLGIHALSDDAPELVVSGINLGYNHGAGFVMSSGTVGAAVEAWVSGIPAVAFSTGTMGDWAEWRTKVLSPDSSGGWARLAQMCAGLLDRLLDSGITSHCDVLNVNVPFDATPDTGCRVTSVARVGYDQLFRQISESTFVHDFGGGLRQFADLAGSDVATASDGLVSVTPLRLPSAAQLPDAIRQAVESPSPRRPVG